MHTLASARAGVAQCGMSGQRAAHRVARDARSEGDIAVREDPRAANAQLALVHLTLAAEKVGEVPRVVGHVEDLGGSLLGVLLAGGKDRRRKLELHGVRGPRLRRTHLALLAAREAARGRVGVNAAAALEVGVVEDVQVGVAVVNHRDHIAVDVDTDAAGDGDGEAVAVDDEEGAHLAVRRR